MINNFNRAQIWVETAIYTLIGLTIIAIILTIATPQIEKIQERQVITQTITSLNELNNEIQNVEQSAGNRKIIFLKITKGKLEINPSNNKITYTLDNAKLEFSEPGKQIIEGDIIIQTDKFGNRYNIKLELDYKTGPETILDIKFKNDNINVEILHSGATPYKLQLENKGIVNIGDPTIIDISLP